MSLTIHIWALLVALSHQAAAVDQCYVCIENCPEPLHVHDCSKDNFVGDLKCFTIEVHSGNRTHTEKGCLPAAVADQKCAELSSHVGVTCRTCDSELCNGVQHISGGPSSGRMVVVGPLTLFCLLLRFFN